MVAASGQSPTLGLLGSVRGTAGKHVSIFNLPFEHATGRGVEGSRGAEGRCRQRYSTHSETSNENIDLFPLAMQRDFLLVGTHSGGMMDLGNGIV